MEKIICEVTRIVKETAYSKTFYIESKNAPLGYRAGQFLTFMLDVDETEIRRSYSFGSTPHIDKEAFITFKRIANGRASRFLFDKVIEGTLLKALSPAGKFTLEKNFSSYFFIAAGSGITPIFSLIKEVLYNYFTSNVILVYQNTNEAESIYRNALVELQKRFAKRFHLIEIFSQPIDHSFPAYRLNNNLLEQILLREVSTVSIIFYICGPTSFMKMSEYTLKVMGYGDKQIRKENFVVDYVPVPFMTDTAPKRVTIHYNGNVYNIDVAYPHNILEVVLKHNIQLPYSCRGGRCSTCAAKCINGTVKMSLNEVLTEEDLLKGLVLTCVGYPETDVELQFDYDL